jgi:hypothetical protein
LPDRLQRMPSGGFSIRATGGVRLNQRSQRIYKTLSFTLHHSMDIDGLAGVAA